MSSSARRLHPRLPIFALTRGDRAVIYTPGHVAAVHRRELPGVAAALDGTDDGALEGMDWLRVVVDRARRSREAWQRWPAAGLEPRRLCVYLGSATCDAPTASPRRPTAKIRKVRSSSPAW